MFIFIVPTWAISIQSGYEVKARLLKGNPVSSSFGYLIIDSIVAPRDKMDVSRQLVQTTQFSSKDAYGNIINLRGAHCSFRLIFVTMG